MTIGSLFSGIGGFEYIASLYGIEPVWASEIEEPCIRITKRHFPNMKHYGDITKMNGAEIEPVDIISGGSPCQDISAAGKQAGINRKCSACGMILPLDFSDDSCPKCGAEIELTRSGLFMEQIRIIKEMRKATNERFPKVVVWENVSAAISSNNGDDFQCVLSEFAGLFGEKLPTLRPEKWCKAGEIVGDKGSLAWRTLDAQHWGVPQRRKRIYLIVDLTGQRAGEILFKSESLRGHTPQGEVSWKRTSGAVKNSLGAADRAGKAESGEVESCVVLNDQGGSVMDVTEGKTGTLRAETHGHAPVVVDDVDKTVYGICSLGSNCMKSDNPDSGCYKTEVSKTLDTSGANPSCNQGGNVVVETPVYCIQGNCIDMADTANCNGKGWKEDICYTLTTIDRPAVAYSVCSKGNGDTFISDKAYTMTTGGGQAGQGYPCVLEEKREIHSAGVAFEQGPGVPNLPYYEEKTPPLTCSQKLAVMIENHPADSRVIESGDVCQTLSARMGTGGGNVPLVMETNPDCIYAVTDCSHTQVCIDQSPTLTARDYKSPHLVSIPKYIDWKGADKYVTTSRNPILCLLWKTYGAKKMVQWGVAVLEALQSAEILQPRLHDKCIQICSKAWRRVDDTSPICPNLVADRLLRDMQIGKECRCTPHRWKSEEQRSLQFAEIMSKLSQSSTPPTETLFNMWQNGEGLWVLQQTLFAIQEIWTSTRHESRWGNSIVRRLTPLEATRLQGFPDGWVDGESDAAQYKALGNSVALPCVDYVMSGVVDVLDPIE